MEYLIYARKFRPQGFDDVVGQEPITTTLKNAIRQGRIPQSFLFSGPRGVGKTSTARILAKALNCAKGPTLEPCEKCDACREITAGNSLDVLEIDGASNRGIDEIRNLRETVKFKAASGRYKVYIIDEVHMLTTEAFNALLKTLEEPPSHVKFIFATTENHKVPLTILSRCQRFHFKRIPTGEIATKLEEIAKKEKLKYEKGALHLVAKAADGALRDAESLLDQLASFSDGTIKNEDVLMMLGLSGDSLYLDVLTALKARDADKIFTLVRELYEGGRDLVQFAKGLFEIFRHLALFQCAAKAEDFAEVSAEMAAELKKRAQEFSRGEVLLGLNILNQLQGQLRRNLAPPKLLVETTLLKLLHLDGLRSVEEMLAQGGGVPPRAAQPAAPVYPSSAPVRPTVLPSAATPAAAPAPGPAAVSQTQPVVSALTSADLETLWARVIEYVKSKRMSTGLFLSEATPVEFGQNVVTLALPSEFQFHKDTLEKDANRRLVEEAIEVLSGRKLRVQFVIAQAVKTEGQAAPEPKPAADGKLPEIITQALDIFEGAKVVRRE